MPEPTVSKNMRIPWALNEKLEQTAQSTGKTQTQIIAVALKEYLTKLNPGT